jgi:hypothetical protein
MQHVPPSKTLVYNQKTSWCSNPEYILTHTKVETSNPTFLDDDNDICSSIKSSLSGQGRPLLKGIFIAMMTFELEEVSLQYKEILLHSKAYFQKYGKLTLVPTASIIRECRGNPDDEGSKHL